MPSEHTMELYHDMEFTGTETGAPPFFFFFFFFFSGSTTR